MSSGKAKQVEVLATQSMNSAGRDCQRSSTYAPSLSDRVSLCHLGSPMYQFNQWRRLAGCLTAIVASTLVGCGKSEDPATGGGSLRPDGISSPTPAVNGRVDAGPGNTTKDASIYDATYGAPVLAVSLQIPGEWQAHGGIRWNEQTDCVANAFRMDWSATSPDGRWAIDLLPGFSWQIAGWEVQLNPCPVAPLSSVNEYLQSLARTLYPGAAIVDYRDRPDIVAELQSGAPPADSIGLHGSKMHSRLEVGEIMLRNELDGQLTETTINAVANFTDVTFPGQRTSRMGGVNSLYVVRAPAGKLDFELGERVRRSMRYDKTWQEQTTAYSRQRIDAHAQNQLAGIRRWHSQRMGEISARGAADRAAIRSQTIREVGEINAAGWKSRQASIDRMHRDNVDTIREVNRYNDPAVGGQVELSSHYNYGFRTNSGEYVATDDPNFEGQELQRAQ